MVVDHKLRPSEIGSIPVDWELKCLCEISPAQSVGLVINPSSYYDEKGTVPILVGSQVMENCILWELAKRITPESNHRLQASRLSTGDIVMVRVGDPGITAVVPAHLDGCNCASMMIVRKHSSFNSLWLCYMMNSRRGRQQVENVQYGTAQKQFNISDAINFKYAVPSLAEQEAIAEALSDADAWIESLEQLIAKKRQIKQGAMQELLTGKRRLPGFNGEWERKCLGRYSRFLRNGTNSRSELLVEGKVKYLHYGDIHACQNVHLAPKDLPCLPQAKAATLDCLQDGDLVLADASEDKIGISKSVEITNVDSQEVVSGLHTIAVRFEPGLFAPGFAGYLQHCPPFNSHLRKLAAGTKVYATNRNHVATVEIEVPPYFEQAAIVEAVSEMDAEITAIESKLSKALQIKQAMMQELLTGRIRLVKPTATKVTMREAVNA